MAAGLTRTICAGVLFALTVVVVEAGGWVVITVADLPDYVVAGKPVTLTYAVRQHGRTLLGDLRGIVEARSGTKVVSTVTAPAAEPGHYTATLTLPHAGAWAIDIRSGFGGNFDRSTMTLRAIEPGRLAPEIAEPERGQRLFAAKGCITCHSHAASPGKSIPAGPALTAKRYQPDYLRGFLADPTKRTPRKPDVEQMPDLKLRPKEIAALVAFLNADSKRLAQR